MSASVFFEPFALKVRAAGVDSGRDGNGSGNPRRRAHAWRSADSDAAKTENPGTAAPALRRTVPAGGFGNLTAFIDQGSEFEGKLSFKDTVRIDGTFSGEISSDNTLIVGETGRDPRQDSPRSRVVISGRRRRRRRRERAGRAPQDGGRERGSSSRRPSIVDGRGRAAERARCAWPRAAAAAGGKKADIKAVPNASQSSKTGSGSGS